MIIGIEGVSCTGKTTLCAALRPLLGAALTIPCYYHTAPDPDMLPNPVATSAQEQLEGMRVLLGIERVRRARAEEAMNHGRLIVLDRTVDTLLAHTRAVARIQGLDSDHAARTLAAGSTPLIPDLTLLLRAPSDVLTERARRRPGLPPIFYDGAFTRHFEDHFSRPLARTCVRVDATQPTHVLAAHAHQLIKEHATAQPTGGER